MTIEGIRLDDRSVTAVTMTSVSWQSGRNRVAPQQFWIEQVLQHIGLPHLRRPREAEAPLYLQYGAGVVILVAVTHLIVVVISGLVIPIKDAN